ncbi:amidohydrolase family protein [Paraglaciecola sp.]|uniref:amidohydrolase family protein n=1 Tax=Paraglaciecola sp. TaxID=1920173 RepID=UPI00329A29AB
MSSHPFRLWSNKVTCQVSHTVNFSLLDSHQHIWALDKGYYHWLTPDISDLYRDFSVDDYKQVATSSCRANTSINTVLVQAAASDAETDYMLAQAASHPLIAGVVGWVDFEKDSQQICERLKMLAANSAFKGVRPMLQDIDDINWILNPEFAPIFKQLIALDLSFDALCRVEHLPNILRLATQYPDLPIVIDHCAKPNVSEGEIAVWSGAMSAFKDLPNVFVKISGLTLEASLKQQDCKSFRPYFNLLHQTFGATRMMWGSDWPVVNINSDYCTWLRISEQLVEQWSITDSERFWSGTAKVFYKIGVQ